MRRGWWCTVLDDFYFTSYSVGNCFWSIRRSEKVKRRLVAADITMGDTVQWRHHRDYSCKQSWLSKCGITDPGPGYQSYERLIQIKTSGTRILEELTSIADNQFACLGWKMTGLEYFRKWWSTTDVVANVLILIHTWWNQDFTEKTKQLYLTFKSCGDFSNMVESGIS